LLLVGALIGYSPMLARNVAVGAPWGPRYFGSMLALATTNHPDNPDHLISNQLPNNPARFEADMRRAQGSPGKLLATLAADYGSGIGRWPLRWGRRVLALGLGADITENLCYAFFRIKAPMLWATTDFYWIWPLALAGALALGRRRWRARLSGPLGLVAACGLAFFGMVSMVYPFGRYRLILLPALAPLAGLAVAKGLALARCRRWERLAWLGLSVVGCLLAQYVILATETPEGFYGLRPAEYVVVGRCYLDDGRYQDAIDIAREGLMRFPGSPHLNMALALSEGIAAHSKGDYDAALAAWRRALTIDSTNRTAQTGARRAAARLPMRFGHHEETNP
jgi:tetratricopeptide (TPR) repeat protein